MATFKMTIAEDTPLWKAIGALSSKARNAEIYRLATTGLISQSHGHSAIAPSRAGNEVHELVEKPQANAQLYDEPTADMNGGFLAVDFQEDLQFLTGN